jgi:hypothetical protein
MHLRNGLALTSIAGILACGAVVACSSTSSVTLQDGGQEGSTPPHQDSGKPPTHDSGKPAHDAGLDSGKSTTPDAGQDTTTPCSGCVDGGTGDADATTLVGDTGVDSSKPGDAAKDTGVIYFDAGSANDADITACSASAAAVCALQARCNLPQQRSQYGDGGTCFTRENEDCVTALLTPNNGNTAAHIAACASSRSGESCATAYDLGTPDACAQPTGSGQTGTSCTHDGQCASGFCALPVTSACGTCQAQPAAGASCTDLAGCGAGLECYDGVCAAYVTTVGGTCSDTKPCGYELDCVSGACASQGTTVGTACGGLLPGCAPTLGLYCKPTTTGSTVGTCQTASIATAGQACGVIANVETVCGAESVCYKQPADAGSKCIARAADNGACNTVTGPDCIPFSRCVGTVIDGGSSGACIPEGTYTCP